MSKSENTNHEQRNFYMENYGTYKILQERIHQLEQENEHLRKELEECKNKISKREEYLLEQKNKQNALKELFERFPSEYYQLKDSLLNHSEGIYYNAICKELFYSEFASSYSDKYKKLYVFPQVALHSVIELTTRGVHYDLDDDIFFTRKFLSKSIDFLICSSQTQYITANKTPNFRPLLAIEIDGAHHDEKKQMARDMEKNTVLDVSGLPLIRYDLTKKNKESLERIIRKELLGK